MRLQLFLPLLFAFFITGNHGNVIRRPKRETTRDWLLQALQYMDSNPETLEELLSEDQTVLEGDIVLASNKNAARHRWPTRNISYVVSPQLAIQKRDIESAVSMVTSKTCISFHPRTNEEDYLLFLPSKGCASYVGFLGGEQPVFIGPHCRVGNIVHELFHTLGFFHEHTRSDRDDYITVLTGNIMKGKERNFKKTMGETFDMPYDISSIMHYGRWYFSANNSPTIIAKVEEKDMGQRLYMTQMDVDRISYLYGCGAEPGHKKTVDVQNNCEEEEADTANAAEAEEPAAPRCKTEKEAEEAVASRCKPQETK